MNKLPVLNLLLVLVACVGSFVGRQHKNVNVNVQYTQILNFSTYNNSWGVDMPLRSIILMKISYGLPFCLHTIIYKNDNFGNILDDPEKRSFHSHAATYDNIDTSI